MSCIPKKSTADQQQFVAPPAQAMSTAVDCEERAPGDVLQGGGKGGAGFSTETSWPKCCTFRCCCWQAGCVEMELKCQYLCIKFQC